MRQAIQDNLIAIGVIASIVVVFILWGGNLFESRFVTRVEYNGFCNAMEIQTQNTKEQITDIKKMQLDIQKDIKTLIRMQSK
jgi:hypothetical protein